MSRIALQEFKSSRVQINFFHKMTTTYTKIKILQHKTRLHITRKNKSQHQNMSNCRKGSQQKTARKRISKRGPCKNSPEPLSYEENTR